MSEELKDKTDKANEKVAVSEVVQARAEKLARDIRHYSRTYYLIDDPTVAPEISDAEFDKLVKELRQLEANNPTLKLKSSPTEEVGAPPSKLFEEIHHQTPMLSLDNAFGLDELDDWIGRLLKLTGQPDKLMGQPDSIPPLVCELKFDGAGISLLYEDGKLRQAATRGDGAVGENITENVSMLDALPKQLKGDFPKRLEVRGEVYMPISAFARLNEEREKRHQKPYANPRNTAAGSLRQKDTAAVSVRTLSWWCYQLASFEGLPRGVKPFATHSESLKYLKGLGFPLNPETKVLESVEAIREYLADILERRHDRDYEVDGVVIKLDKISDQRVVGATSHHPRWAVAYKFPAEEKTTELLDIEISVGPGGKATPIAHLAPVVVGGSTIQRAVLHNEDQVKEKDLRVGDVVIVKKAGDVLPEVVGPVVAERKTKMPAPKPWVFPKKCPCPHKTTLVREPGEAAHTCPNEECPHQNIGRLAHFVSRSAMDIDGLGKKWIEAFVEQNLVADVADIYFLDFEALAELRNADDRKYGKLLAEKLKATVTASKKQPLSRLLFALAIPNIGKTAAQDIADFFGTMSAVMNVKPSDLEDIDGIGEVQAQNVCDFMAHPSKKALIAKLKKAGVNMSQPRLEAVDKSLANQSFVITGTFSDMSREEASAQVRARGGKVQGSVSGATDYLVVGRNPGSSKVKKANDLGTKTIDEPTFLKLLNL